MPKIQRILFISVDARPQMKENGDGGKSYFFFRAVAEVFKDKISPRFVMYVATFL